MRELIGEREAMDYMAMTKALLQPMTFKRHKALTAIAYQVKKLIDSKGGLSEHEGCAFGQLMQQLIYLK